MPGLYPGGAAIELQMMAVVALWGFAETNFPPKHAGGGWGTVGVARSWAGGAPF